MGNLDRKPTLESVVIRDIQPTHRVSEGSSDPEYGRTSGKPIRLGGGVAGCRRFLLGLAGPSGQALQHHLIGAVFGPDGTILDKYGLLHLDDCGQAVRQVLFLDMYTCEDPRIPLGLTRKV